MCRLFCVVLWRGWAETVGRKDVIVHTSEVCGMSAIEKEITIPSNNNVLEGGRDGSVGVLTKVVLKDVDSVLAGVEWLTNINGSIVKADKL